VVTGLRPTYEDEKRLRFRNLSTGNHPLLCHHERLCPVPGNGPPLSATLSFLSSREVVTFLISLVFGTPNQNVFQNSHKTVILSEAPRESIA
jgi:hypothetical protein